MIIPKRYAVLGFCLKNNIFRAADNGRIQINGKIQMEEKNFRHEYKYPVTDAQIAMLKNRIRSLIRLDDHAEGGMYNIRSLYFDDYTNRCFYENQNGTDPREKFRIRIYNHSSERIALECKRKEREKTLKTSCLITKEQAQGLMRGECLPDIAQQPPMLRRLTLEMMMRHMRPAVIVEYDRIPYVYSDGNVRITFDMNISSSADISGFLDDNIAKRPVMATGMQLMEVKFDEFLPDFIYRSLQLNSLCRTAYSKYYLCRRFNLPKI